MFPSHKNNKSSQRIPTKNIIPATSWLFHDRALCLKNCLVSSSLLAGWNVQIIFEHKSWAKNKTVSQDIKCTTLNNLLYFGVFVSPLRIFWAEQMVKSSKKLSAEIVVGSLLKLFKQVRCQAWASFVNRNFFFCLLLPKEFVIIGTYFSNLHFNPRKKRVLREGSKSFFDMSFEKKRWKL